MTEAMITAQVTHRYKPEKATECISIFGQFVEFGSVAAAFTSAIAQPPMKKVSARATGSDLVCRSADKESALSSYM